MCGGSPHDEVWVIRMLNTNHVTVVIPVLNEAKAIGLVIDELVSHGIPPTSIVVVDGHSVDGSDKIARSRGVAVVYQDGKGKADAVRKGLEYVKTRYAIVMDGDYTYPSKYIPLLLEKAVRDRCVEVIGARVNGRENIPLVNRFGNRVITAAFNILHGTRLRDVLSGMYVIDVGELHDMLFETRGFSIEIEMATHVVSNGLEICEVPIDYRARIGEKKLKTVDGLRIALDLIRSVWRYNPVMLIFLLSSLLLIPGLVLGGYVAYHYFFTGIKYYVRGLIAIILTVVGFNSLLLAILSIYLKRMEVRIRRGIRLLQEQISKSHH